MSGEYVCNLCGFRVPADEIGAALMQQHLLEEHGHHTPSTSGQHR